MGRVPIPSLTKSANTYVFDKLNVSLIAMQKAVFLCKNQNSALSEHARKPTHRFGGVIPKLIILLNYYEIYYYYYYYY